LNKFILSAFGDEIHPDLKVQLKVLKAHHISYIDLRMVQGISILNYSLEEVKVIKNQLDAMNIKVSALASPIGKISIGDAFKPELELFKHALKIAKLLEAKYIRIFSYYIPSGQAPENFREEVLARITALTALAEKHNIILLHENEKEIYGDSPERCLDILTSVNSSHLKAILDPANFIQCGEEAFPKAYKMLKSYIVYFHIKDARLGDGSVLPAGEGDGRIPELLELLAAEGFEGFLSLEPHLYEFEGMQNLELNPELNKADNCGEFFFHKAHEALVKLIK
jgi:sugar phosphate isomerase/epimerase